MRRATGQPHGTNERIPVAVMADGVAFLKRYIRKVSEK